MFENIFVHASLSEILGLLMATIFVVGCILIFFTMSFVDMAKRRFRRLKNWWKTRKDRKKQTKLSDRDIVNEIDRILMDVAHWPPKTRSEIPGLVQLLVETLHKTEEENVLLRIERDRVGEMPEELRQLEEEEFEESERLLDQVEKGEYP